MNYFTYCLISDDCDIQFDGGLFVATKGAS